MVSALVDNAADLMSASSSGKALRHEARSECRASFSSFSFLPGRLHIRSSHRDCRDDRLPYTDSARNVFLCNERFMSEPSEERVVEKSVMSGLISVEYVFGRMA